MTDSQYKYNTLRETARHNFEMESLSRGELATKQEQARAATTQAQAATAQAEVAAVNAQTRKDELKQKKTEHGWSTAWNFVSYLLPDANTVTRAGASVLSSLFG